MAVCRDCGWKIVAPSVAAHVAAHRSPQGPHRGRPAPKGVTVEPWEAEHPTMTHEDAERIGRCWHAAALAEDAERAENAVGKRADDPHP